MILTVLLRWTSGDPYLSYSWSGLESPYVRFIRADRTGGVVSRRFSFREEGHHLIALLWRLSH